MTILMSVNGHSKPLSLKGDPRMYVEIVSPENGQSGETLSGFKTSLFI